MEKENKKLSLEELFKEVDIIATELEKEDISLEDSYKLYDRGMAILKQCNETIDAVEKKVMILDENGDTHEF